MVSEMLATFDDSGRGSTTMVAYSVGVITSFTGSNSLFPQAVRPKMRSKIRSEMIDLFFIILFMFILFCVKFNRLQQGFHTPETYHTLATYPEVQYNSWFRYACR